jgi:hypothetical protein
MKVTENRLDTLIDNLNTLICEDSLLTRQERNLCWPWPPSAP